jgi:hypothetical protein
MAGYKTVSKDYVGEPWDRQPRESDYQYARFRTYLELGRTRTVQMTCDLLNDLGDQIRFNSLQEVSHRNLWRDRAERWERAQDEREFEVLRRERREAIESQKEAAKALITKALEALRVIDVYEMTPADVVRYIKLATDVQRIIFGDITVPTMTSNDMVNDSELTGLSEAERRERLLELSKELESRALADD